MEIQNGYASLTDMMRKAPLTEDTVRAFRDRALDNVSHAIDVFFRPEREVDEGRVAYDRLTDTERALRAYQERFIRESKAAQNDAEATLHGMCKDLGGREDIKDQASALADGKPIHDGVRVRDCARVDSNRYNLRSEGPDGRIQALVEKMASILPTYGAVAMVPGPLSVSLKNHVQETLQVKMRSSSYSEHEIRQASVRLLTLSAGRGTMTTRHSSSTETTANISSTTADERVLPGLQSIRNSLEAIRFTPQQLMNIDASQEVSEFEKVERTTGHVFKKHVVEEEQVNHGSLKLGHQEVPYVPAGLALGGAPSNQGLSHATSGSDVLDLVEQSELTPEFLDAFRDRASAILNQAVATMFKPEREISEGRRSYDELTNLGRALKRAQARWGDDSKYRSILPDQITTLDHVTPLYACVAMVPGELSSSVKNFAKEVADYHREDSSSWETTAHSTRASLLTLGVKDTTDTASAGSSMSTSLKYETSTTDERIMPALHQLQVQLDQLQIGNSQSKPVLVIAPPQDNRY